MTAPRRFHAREQVKVQVRHPRTRRKKLQDAVVIRAVPPHSVKVKYTVDGVTYTAIVPSHKVFRVGDPLADHTAQAIERILAASEWEAKQ